MRVTLHGAGMTVRLLLRVETEAAGSSGENEELGPLNLLAVCESGDDEK